VYLVNIYRLEIALLLHRSPGSLLQSGRYR